VGKGRRMSGNWDAENLIRWRRGGSRGEIFCEDSLTGEQAEGLHKEGGDRERHGKS